MQHISWNGRSLKRQTETQKWIWEESILSLSRKPSKCTELHLVVSSAYEVKKKQPTSRLKAVCTSLGFQLHQQLKQFAKKVFVWDIWMEASNVVVLERIRFVCVVINWARTKKSIGKVLSFVLRNVPRMVVVVLDTITCHHDQKSVDNGGFQDEEISIWKHGERFLICFDLIWFVNFHSFDFVIHFSESSSQSRGICLHWLWFKDCWSWNFIWNTTTASFSRSSCRFFVHSAQCNTRSSRDCSSQRTERWEK